MFKSTQTGLGSIIEELDNSKEVDFREYFGKKQLNRNRKAEEEKSRANIEEYKFLQKNWSLIDSKEQKLNIDSELEQKRNEINAINNKKTSKFDIFNNRVYDKRNPAINELLKDVRANTGLNQLQDELKKEFDMFLTTSLKSTTESFKNLSRESSAMPKSSGIFLTQDDNAELEEEEEEEEEEEKEDDVEEELVRIIEKEEKSVIPNKSKAKKQIKPKTNAVAIIEKQPEKNWQLSVFGQEESNASVIKLNKMLESIKRIDLPKFQPELHQICQYGADVKLLELYSDELDQNLNKQTNGLGRFCIHECCVKGNVKMLKAMLPYIDDINKVDNNHQTAAHVAAKFDELESLKILYANGINLELPDKFGVQVAHIAAQQNHTDIIEFLFEIGICFNTGCNLGKISFHYAAEYGSFESLKILSKYYVDISITDNDENTAAHLAAKNDHLNCVQYLIKLGLPVDIVRNSHGRNVAHICCLNGSLKTLHWLLENGTDKDAVDGYGNNLAANCCLNGQGECFNCCVQHDVQVDLLNKLDETPLDIARKCGKGYHIEKSAINQIRCTYCVDNAIKLKIEKESNSQMAVPKSQEKKASAKSTKRWNRNRVKLDNHQQGIHSANGVDLDKRDFISQYFGPDI